MKRFKNILVVYNHVVGDDDAFRQATILAKRNQARVTLVDVFEDPAHHADAVAERKKHMDRLAASIHQDGVAVEAVVLEGVKFLEIIRQVLRGGHDLVIITADGIEGVREFFFGNTSMRLMRKCPCAVWVVHPGGRNDYARILAAIDPRPDDAAAQELNTKIMDLATSQAVLNNSELHLVHAWDVTGHDLATLRSEAAVLGPEGSHQEILRDHEAMHRETLEGFLGRYDVADLRSHIHLPRGDPGILIPRIADNQRIDLIVMGTVVRTGIPGFLIGNTAETVLRIVNCAVLTVKPEGFVTPVTLEVQ